MSAIVYNRAWFKIIINYTEELVVHVFLQELELAKKY
jgi:hypothetical protein